MRKASRTQRRIADRRLGETALKAEQAAPFQRFGVVDARPAPITARRVVQLSGRW